MPPKSNNQKKKEAEAAGKAPKKTKQQENAGKSASQKKAEMQVKPQFKSLNNCIKCLDNKLRYILPFAGQACCRQGEEIWWLVNYYVIKLVHVDVQSNLWNPFFMA